MCEGDAENGGGASANDITICAVTCKSEPTDAVRAYVEAGITPATRRAYKADLEHFRAWGGDIPTTDIQLAAYLAEQPFFASAYAWKACTLGQAWSNEFRPRTPELFRETIRLVERAASLDENNTECHRIMCRIALMQAKFAKSEYHLERALALNPNDPRLVAQRGINLIFLGDPEAAIPWIEKAMRLDPFSAFRYYLDLVRALFMAGRPAEALAVLERTTREHWEHYVWAAASNAAQNELSAAIESAQRSIALRPHLSIASYIDGRFKWKRSEDSARLRDALARAGLPK
jgi:adenylate cyclase